MSRSSSAAEPVRGQGVAQPLPWLVGVLAVGLFLRAWHLTDGYQVDELTAVAAVAERQSVPAGYTATADDPLVPVASLDEVSKRSVIPYGVRDPHPLYHDILYGVLQALPPSDWSLRLPSLLAGLGCVAVIFFLTRRLLGAEVGLLAAAIVALDPIQVSVSWLARPYALANFACLLSFAALLGLLRTTRPAVGALCAVGYALSVAAVGYLSPVMLLVVTAHAGMVVYAAFAAGRAGAAWRGLLWVVGLSVAVVLLLPEIGYWQDLFGWGRGHWEYLLRLQPIHLWTVLWHNVVLLGGLALALVAAAAVRWQVQGEPAPEEEARPASGTQPVGPASTAVAPALAAVAPAGPITSPALEANAPRIADEGAPLPENDEAVWMGRLWVFVPQLFTLVAAYATAQSIFQTRYLSYTTLGAAILLAYYATRERSREVRLGVAAVLCLTLLVLGFFPEWGAGVGLFGNNRAKDLADGLRVRMTSWREGDVLLMRAGLAESDWLANDIPAAARPEVERAVLAPLTTLYVDAVHRPVLPLTLSHYRNKTVHPLAGEYCRPGDYYDAAFADRVRQYERYWLTGLAPGQDFTTPYYLACVLPWLADTLGWDVVVARNRGESGNPERYVEVPTDVKPDDDIDGLTYNTKRDDFVVFVHLARPRQPRGVYMLGALGLAPLPNAYVTVPVMLSFENPTPRLRKNPEPAEGK